MELLSEFLMGRVKAGGDATTYSIGGLTVVAASAIMVVCYAGFMWTRKTITNERDLNFSDGAASKRRKKSRVAV